MYFAYGSNLWIRQMDNRCPDNVKVGIGVLHGYRWIITTRGYANIIKSPDDDVWGVVYKISSNDEEALDRHEGVNQGLYNKKYLEISIPGEVQECLVYLDQIIQEGLPDTEYISRINKGIIDANLPPNYVNKYLRGKIPL